LATVLVVDDDPDIAEAMSAIIAGEGHEVVIARNGQEGLARVYDAVPDVILLDLDMPVLDGAGMMRRLDERQLAGGPCRVILVSATPQLTRVAAALNAHHYLRKPFTVEQLLAVLSRAATA
jgi:CheY-like chemotaxis protein